MENIMKFVNYLRATSALQHRLLRTFLTEVRELLILINFVFYGENVSFFSNNVYSFPQWNCSDDTVGQTWVMTVQKKEIKKNLLKSGITYIKI